MTKTIDLSPLTAALDAREWRIVAGYEDGIADALAAVVGRGATEDDLRRLLRQYTADDNLIRRLLPAARHLQREREAAQ